MTEDAIPFACILNSPAAAAQVTAWSQFAGACVSIASDRPGWFQAHFPTEVEAQLRAVAETERRCCAFLDIDISHDADRVVLTIGVPNPDAYPIVETIRTALAAPRMPSAPATVHDAPPPPRRPPLKPATRV